MTRLIKNTKLLSKLLHSVGKQGRGSSQRQPLTPIDTAKLIKRFMEDENLDGHKASERLGLGRARDTTVSLFEDTDKTQVEFFLKLLELSPASREFCAWNWEKGIDRINMTTLFRLNALTHEDQDHIIQSIRKQKREFRDSGGESVKPLTSKEALKISQERRANPQVPIDEFIEKTLKIRPIVEIHNFIVCTMGEKLKNFVESNDGYIPKLLEILRNNMNGVFYDIDAENGRTITIEMDPIGLKVFDEQQSKKEIPYSQFLNEFMEDKIA